MLLSIVSPTLKGFFVNVTTRGFSSLFLVQIRIITLLDFHSLYYSFSVWSPAIYVEMTMIFSIISPNLKSFVANVTRVSQGLSQIEIRIRTELDFYSLDYSFIVLSANNCLEMIMIFSIILPNSL